MSDSSQRVSAKYFTISRRLQRYCAKHSIAVDSKDSRDVMTSVVLSWENVVDDSQNWHPVFQTVTQSLLAKQFRGTERKMTNHHFRWITPKFDPDSNALNQELSAYFKKLHPENPNGAYLCKPIGLFVAILHLANNRDEQQCTCTEISLWLKARPEKLQEFFNLLAPIVATWKKHYRCKPLLVERTPVPVAIPVRAPLVQ